MPSITREGRAATGLTSNPGFEWSWGFSFLADVQGVFRPC